MPSGERLWRRTTRPLSHARRLCRAYLPLVHLSETRFVLLSARLSAHWEEKSHTVLTHPSPPLLYDYYGFPPEAYQLSWPAPGATAVAERVQHLLRNAGLPCAADARRGYDHGVFVPMLVAFPEASIPVTQVSLLTSLDPAAHLALGKALAPLRDENVLILGSGFSFHNLGSMRDTLLSGVNRGGAADKVRTASKAFDAWLVETLCGQLDPAQREQRILAWAKAPRGACVCADVIVSHRADSLRHNTARECHPREEHLMPLFIAAAAAGFAPAEHTWGDTVNGTIQTSAFEWL